MNFGDIGKRFVAWLIDSVIVSAAVGFLYWMWWLLQYNLNPYWSLHDWSLDSFGTMVWWKWLWLTLAPAVVSLLYFTLMESSKIHATLGKKAMGLYVTDMTGKGVNYSYAILRWLCKMISGLTLGIGYLICLFNPQKQCLHDMLAKTYVLGGSGRTASAPAPAKEPQVVCVSGPLSGMVYSVSKAGVQIGRDSKKCQITLPGTEGRVSRVHCAVTYSEASRMFVLCDRNSTQGTFLANGTRLQSGQAISLPGGSRFYVATPDNMFEVR